MQDGSSVTVLPISSSCAQLTPKRLHDMRTKVEQSSPGKSMMALIDGAGGVSFTVLHTGLVPPAEGLATRRQTEEHAT